MVFCVHCSNAPELDIHDHAVDLDKNNLCTKGLRMASNRGIGEPDKISRRYSSAGSLHIDLITRYFPDTELECRVPLCAGSMTCTNWGFSDKRAPGRWNPCQSVAQTQPCHAACGRGACGTIDGGLPGPIARRASRWRYLLRNVWIQAFSVRIAVPEAPHGVGNQSGDAGFLTYAKKTASENRMAFEYRT